MDANFGKAQALAEYADKIRWAMSNIAELHVQLGQQGWKDAEQVQHPLRASERKPRYQLVVGPRLPHILVKSKLQGGGFQWQCSRCGREASTWNGQRRLAATECSGSSVARLKPVALADARFRPNGHDLRTCDNLVFCRLCARYAVRNLRGLKASCPGPPTSRDSTQLRRMRIGLHPITKQWLGRVQMLRAEDWSKMLGGT